MGHAESKDSKEDTKNANESRSYKRCLHDIRNIKTLNPEMINNIRNMSNEEKMRIIIAFNEVVDCLQQLIA